MRLLPCPFCATELEEVPAFSNRSARYFSHPPADDLPCIAANINVVVSDRQHDQERIAAWNRRDFPPAKETPRSERGDTDADPS